MACAACELRVATVPALEARLDQKYREMEQRAQLEGALPYMADMLCMIARMLTPEWAAKPYTQLIRPESAPAKDERTALEIIDDVLAAL